MKGMSADNLSFVRYAPARQQIIERLRQNGIEDWSDLKGRQVPARLVTDLRNCGPGTVERFARFVREHSGFVTVDAPPGWRF